MSDTTYTDGTYWESGYYSAKARQLFALAVLGTCIATLGALTTEWDPVQSLEVLPDWQKGVAGLLITYIGFRSGMLAWTETALLNSNHYEPYSARQKQKRRENHGMG